MSEVRDLERDKKLEQAFTRTDKERRKIIIKNFIAKVKDTEGKLPPDAIKKLEVEYIRMAPKNSIFKKHRTTRQTEIKESLIEEGYEL